MQISNKVIIILYLIIRLNRTRTCSIRIENSSCCLFPGDCYTIIQSQSLNSLLSHEFGDLPSNPVELALPGHLAVHNSTAKWAGSSRSCRRLGSLLNDSTRSNEVGTPSIPASYQNLLWSASIFLVNVALIFISLYLINIKLVRFGGYWR